MNESKFPEQPEGFPEAIEKNREILQTDSKDADAWRNLGIAYYLEEQYQDALEMLQKSLELDSSRAIQHYCFGLVLEKIGYLPQAIQAYQQAIALEPDWIEAYNSLGKALSEAGEFEQAEAIFRQAIALNPNHCDSYLNLGNILLAQQQIDRAIAAYEKALQLSPDNPAILNNLGNTFAAKNEQGYASFYWGYAAYYQGKYAEAIRYYQDLLETQGGDENFYLALADCYFQLNRIEEAIKIYREAIELYPETIDFYLLLMLALQKIGQTPDAIKLVDEALLLFPNDIRLKLESIRLIPILYKSPGEIKFYRTRFTQGLNKFVKQLDLETPKSRLNALKSIGFQTNFYLQYQGSNDLELQKQYGQFVHQVMAGNYPQWVKTVPMPTSEKIRIGYISDCLHWHTVGSVFLGWIKNCDREVFSIFSYSTNQLVDHQTEKFKLYSDTFYHIPDNLEAICEQILCDRLHILIFLDIGMSAQMTQIAGLRLAPIQCAAWGHPVTSGLPTIDYFLSGDLMEPENAQSHYSEELIRLPNIGICYEKPTVPEPTKTRSDFGLREDGVVYLSCQSLFKYLPQYDYIFPSIAQQVPQAQFVFVSHSSPQITEQFRQRLQRAFAEFDLKSEDYCTILPRQDYWDYWNLNLVSDIVLDTFGFTGFLTTLDSAACGLPIVTCPGECMRSRQSYGILKRLGVTEIVAKDEAEYIKIAVKLGWAREWRHTLTQQIIQGHSYLYDDKTCVAALEAFYRRAISNLQD